MDGRSAAMVVCLSCGSGIAAAFWHDENNKNLARDIAQGGEEAGPGNAPGVISVPTGTEPFKSSIYRPSDQAARGGRATIRLRTGPHLFIDDFLISAGRNVRRRVNCPRREPGIPNPIITGKEDHCVAPYLTVLRDPAPGRFRIWYNVYKEKHRDGTARFATLESEDGIHWVRPHRVLDDPGPINFGSAVVDEGPGFPDPAQRYKLAWWAEGGLKIAVSPDGLDWSMFRPDPVVRPNPDINNPLFAA